MIRTSRKPKKLPICKGCRERKEPYRFGAKVCSISCAEIVAKAKSEKDARKLAKAVRATDKTRRDALKNRSDWIKDCQAAFNSFIRWRDRGENCICCGLPFIENSFTARMEAGHFLAVSVAPHLRFDERNCHGQRRSCNVAGETRRSAMRAGVVDRIGPQAVSELESMHSPAKWSIADLKAITAQYRARLREMKGLK